MAKMFNVVIICVISFSGLSDSQYRRIDWLHNLCHYIIDNSTDEYQVAVITAENQRKLANDPRIMYLIKFIMQHRPILHLNIDFASEKNEEDSYKLSTTASTFFMYIGDTQHIYVTLIERILDTLKDLSELKTIMKYLLIFFSSESNFDFDIIFQYSWKKQIVDFTILEIPRCDQSKENKMLETCISNEIIIRHFNPFLNLSTQEFYSPKSQWFPNVMTNLHGYPIKVGVFHSPPFSMVKWKDNLEVESASGADITLTRHLAKKMNFTIKFLPRMIEFHTANNSLKQLFGLLNFYKVDILARVTPHYTEDLEEDAIRSAPILLDDFCALVPKKLEVRIPFSWEAFEGILISIAIICFFWIPALLLRFDKRRWSVFVILRVLFGIPVYGSPLIISQRMFYAILLLISLTYSANIYGSLTRVSIDTDSEVEYRTFDDLAKSPFTFVIPRYLYEKTFSDKKELLLLKNKTINYIEAWKCPFHAQQYKNVSCLISRYEAIIFMNYKHLNSKTDGLKLTNLCFWSDAYSFLLRRDSPLRRSMKHIFLFFTEAGLIKKWYKDDIIDMEIAKDEDENAFFIPRGVLIDQLLAVLLIGYVTSIIVFIGEILFQSITISFHKIILKIKKS
ncbi:uncharacterized protein [Chelonus insularis]|uniref:uncharacterized protein isoform X1 n=1 Tax=Chelonus insularis TaxID=460826 RepID=UPI00158B2598|nr:uncharacterized protein LOC118068761 isoform X1 [Chelonus insularis]